MNMKKINNVAEKIKKAMDELDKAIVTKDKKIFSVSSECQLNKFKVSFSIVLKILASGSLPPKSERDLGISRVIIDQWPCNLELGGILLDAEEAYKEI